jgi:hypothetical protein
MPGLQRLKAIMQSVDRLKSLYDTHMKDDLFMGLLMSEVDYQDALAFVNRMGLRELQGSYKKNGISQKMAGTDTFHKLVGFVRISRRRPVTRPKNYPADISEEKIEQYIVNITSNAKKYLRKIISYIGRDNPVTALKILGKIVDSGRNVQDIRS